MTWGDALARKERRAQRPAAPAPTPTDTASAYGRAAIEREAAEVRATPEGSRNDRLNAAAYSLGQLVAGGVVAESDVWSALRAAAQACGLGSSEADATIASGINAGKAEPRGVPEREPRRAERQPPPDDFGPVDYDDTEPEPASAPRPARSIEILDAEAIWAPLEPPVYVTAGMLRAGSLVELVAFGSSGKSWMGVEIGVAIALGEPAFGRFATVKGPILYLDWEAGSYEMRRRFQAVGRGHGTSDPIAGVSLSSMPNLYMARPDFESRLMPLCEGRSLVVLDTLKAASPGVDENDSSIREGLDALHRVTEKTGCAGLVLTHAKKTSGSLAQIDAREAGRGSSAIFDAADAVFHVLYRKGEPLRVEQTKSRVGRSVEPFLVTIEDTDNEGVCVLGKDVPAEGQGDEFSGLCNAVLEVVKANPGCSVRLVRGLAKAKSTSVGAALEQLERHGAIRNDGKGQAAKWHAVPATGKGRDEWAGDFDDR
ncbi:MAG: AAA family ATPase [Candidatus Eisenbacteria bacterium]|nr:AAA family ATPase [Candidatus Eisenbacteria bacterium]